MKTLNSARLRAHQYVGYYAWSLFVLPATEGIGTFTDNQSNQIKIIPIPFMNEINIEPENPEDVRSIELFDVRGQRVQRIGSDDITSEIIKISVDEPGDKFILRINTRNATISKIILKQ